MQRYRVNYTLLVGLLVGTAVAAGAIYGIWSWQMTGNAQSMLDRAKDAEANGNYKEAVGLLNNYLAFRPDDDDARIRQAQLYVDLGKEALDELEIRDFAIARESIINTLFKYPDRDDLRESLIGMLATDDYFPYFAKDILPHVDVLLKSHPDDRELLLKKARCHVFLQQPEEAVAVLNRLVGFDPQADDGDGAFNVEQAIAPDDIQAYRMLFGIELVQLDQKDAALRVAEQMVKVNPESSQAYLERGRLYAALDEGKGSRNDYGDKSRADLAKAYELGPEDPETLIALAAQAQSDQDYDLTREYLEKGLELGTDMAVFYSGLARLEKAQGNVEEAINQIDRGMKAVDENAQVSLLMDKIDFLIDLGDLTGAEDAIKQVEAKRGQKPPAVEFYEARILASRDDWLRAAHALEEVRPKLSGDRRLRPQADMLLGLAYRKVGYMEKALEVFEQQYRENRSNNFAKAQVEELSRILNPAAAGEEQLSGNFNQRLIAELSKPEEEQDWPAFYDFLETWAEENKRSPVQVKLLKAQALAGQKKYKEAQKLLVEAYNESPEDLAVQRMAVKLVAVDPDRGPESAMKLLDRTVERFKDQWQLRLDRADLYMAMNNETLVEDLLSLTEGMDDWERNQKVQVWKGVAIRLGQAGHREESENAWKQVAELDPNSLPTLMQVFDLALVRNDDEAMRAAQEKVLELVGTKKDANWAFTEAARKFVELRNAPENEKLREEIRDLVATSIEFRPDWSAPYILRASLSMLDRDYLKALDDYRAGFSRGRGNVQALAQYVRLLDAQGSYNEALEQLSPYDSSIAVKIVGRTYPRLLARAGRYRDAVEAADRIAASGDSNSETQLWYGQFLQGIAVTPSVPEDLLEECKNKAGDALAKAVELGGDNPATWLAHISQLLATGQRSAAESALRKAQLRLDEDQQQLLLARCYENMGRWFDAENTYLLAFEQSNESDQVARQMAEFYLSRRYPLRDGPAKAVELINGILHKLADDPESVAAVNANWARRTAAQMLASTDDYQNLLKAEKLLASNSENSTLAVEDKLQMAQILSVRPEPLSRRKAIGLLEEVAAQQPLSPAADLMLGKLYYAVGNWPKCRDHMQSVLTRYPNEAGPLDAYIRMLLDRGSASDLRIAEGQVKRLIQIAPRSPATYELVSLVYNKTGDTNRARQALQGMLPSDLKSLDQNGYRLVSRVAGLLLNLGDVDAAEKLLNALVNRPEATFGDQLQFIKFMGVHRDPQQAFDRLDELVQDDNLLAIAEAAASIVRAKRDEVGDKYDAKIEGWLDRADREDPGSNAVLLARANFEDLRGNYEAAANNYRKVIESGTLIGKPKAAVLNNLAYLLSLGAAKEATPNEAITLVREAVDILGPISDILDTRAVIWLNRGEFQAAADDMADAVTDKPTASKYFHKALAHKGLKQNSAALEAWAKAEDLGLTRESVGVLEQDKYDELAAQIEELRSRGSNL